MADEPGKLTGTVDYYDEEDGEGIIVDSKGQEIFLHHSAIHQDQADKVVEGAAVTFDLAEEEPSGSPKSPPGYAPDMLIAENVRPVGGD